MKINLSGGRVALVQTQFGNEAPVSFWDDKNYRSIRLTVSMFDGPEMLGQVTGVSYCAPGDQFNRRKGRQIAMQRLLDSDNYHVLSKADRMVLCPVLLTGRKNA
jgi:hypothetical protein